MSYHVLHVFRHGATLAKERGFIVCRAQDKSERKLPHEDLRAVIIAARGVTLTSNFVSAVLETDGIILHCNESYQPCGVTAPLERVIDHRAFLNQTSRPKRLNERIWQRILRGKTVNQQRVLEHKELRSPHLELALKSGNIDEGNCAKRYWQLFFPAIGWTSTKRDRKENTAPNQMLNYGYTVLAALCHRSLIVHGLTTALGVQHATRYRSTPLVFDLMEPFRPVVDMMLAEFMTEPEVNMRAWSKKVGTDLRERRVSHHRYSLKLMDAIDSSANSLARSYSQMTVEPFWVPEL
jgi:CRISPR-associated protein Cas1